MISSMVLQFMMLVNGQAVIPNVGLFDNCSCVRHSRSVTCSVNNDIYGDDIRKIVSTTGPDGRVISDNVIIECSMSQR